MVVFFCVLTILIHFVGCVMKPKIIGGQYANITEFPYVAFLKIICANKFHEENSYWICGSSIVNQVLLLTAAHCVSSCQPDSFIIISIGHSATEQGPYSTAHSYLTHDNHTSVSLGYDIGFVRMRTPVRFSSRANRIVIVKSPPYFEKARVAGWGLTAEEEGTVADRLKYVEQYVWRRSECVNLLDDMPKGTICASSGSEEDYIAEGDSGSALVVRGYLQLGIVSYKRPAKSRSVVVYTDIGYFYDWIKQNAVLLLCDESTN